MHQKNLLVIFTMLLATTFLPAQITVTNSVFPAAGDTLRTAFAASAEGINVGNSGGPHTWDFSGMTSAGTDVTIFQAASEGMDFAKFPNAELVVIAGVGAEAYYDVTATTFSALGFSGSELLFGLPIPAILRFNPPLQELHAPLTFPNVFNSNANLALALATADLPGGLLDSLGVPSGFLDSIRVRFTTMRNDFVDAYGTISIPGGTYDVLRQKRTDFSDTRLEIHVPFLGWQDVTDLVGIEGFGKDTTISYSYISNTEKEPIAVVTMDSTGMIAEEVVYKDNGIMSSVSQASQYAPGVIISPNPATTEVTIQLFNLPDDQYSLRLFDGTGKPVLVRALLSTQASVPLGSVSAGMYFYHVTNSKNQVVGSGKLMKANQ